MARRQHIPALTPEKLFALIQQMQQTSIPPQAKAVIENILRAAANPDGESIEAAIKSLPKRRREEIRRSAARYTARFAAIGERGKRKLMSISDAEWRELEE